MVAIGCISGLIIINYIVLSEVVHMDVLEENDVSVTLVGMFGWVTYHFKHVPETCNRNGGARLGSRLPWIIEYSDTPDLIGSVPGRSHQTTHRVVDILGVRKIVCLLGIV